MPPLPENDSPDEQVAPAADEAHVRILILAAGASRRMGRPKQLLPYKGSSLLAHAAHRALATGCAVDVVLGANAEACRRELRDPGVRILENLDWPEGIAASIRCGVLAAPADCRALLVMLCDQPRIPTEHYNALVAAWSAQPAGIVASTYDGTVGVPALFPRERFADLLALRGDRGARALLAREQDRLRTIVCPAARLDLDRPEDFAALQTEA